MEHFIEFLEHTGLALAGLMIYSLIAIRQHLRKFKFKVFWHDNKPFWLWALLLQLIFALLVTFIPASGEAIKTLVGFDLTEPMAFLNTGALLAQMANWAVDKDDKIGQKGNILKEKEEMKEIIQEIKKEE